MAVTFAELFKQAVQQVIGELMYNKVDMEQLEEKYGDKRKPKKSQPAVRKGTVDYSKWDDLSDDDV